MNLRAYLFAISHTTFAATLHAYRQDAIQDDTLTTFEKEQICRAIDTRFGELNKQHATRKARWS